ncbi:hypothetical protein SDC9_212586 [bioreactor metagenome]|uniref:Uncharacterized protein n=1 Tax=bioreactor metagenome TaxID=1076179 RepID=A0A645JQ06_9ZZZZ
MRLDVGGGVDVSDDQGIRVGGLVSGDLLREGHVGHRTARVGIRQEHG